MHLKLNSGHCVENKTKGMSHDQIKLPLGNSITPTPTLLCKNPPPPTLLFPLENICKYMYISCTVPADRRNTVHLSLQQPSVQSGNHGWTSLQSGTAAPEIRISLYQ